MSASDYRALKKANELFISKGYAVSPNELKLIAFHSNGNVNRITDLLSKYQFISNEENRSFAEQLSDALINSKSLEQSNRMKLFNAYIDRLNGGQSDYAWLSNNELINNLDTNLFATRTQAIKDYEKSQIRQLLSSYGVPDENIVMQLYNTKGYNSRSYCANSNLNRTNKRKRSCFKQANTFESSKGSNLYFKSRP